MANASELLRQGRTDELWDMCCGYLRLSIDEFMEVQYRLMTEQLRLLNNCELGQKLFKGKQPQTVEEFRAVAPLTTYRDYGDDFMQHREDMLPTTPAFWVRTSGKTGDHPFKWIPMSGEYAEHLSAILYGIGMVSCADGWGDVSHIPSTINLLYSVAPRPYISGTFADLLREQTPLNYLPPLESAETISFSDRLQLGFKQALAEGMDYFFGLSLVLVMVGERLKEFSNHVDLRPYLRQPAALVRLGKGFIKSRMEGRNYLLPRDLWSIKGIIGSGVDSWVYKERIKELWGREPLDLYSCTEGGVIATQAWDYAGMTPVPSLNYLEFIPEEELLKEEMDRSYRPRTVLLNEVQPGRNYEVVLTNFHGGAMVRYRIGDMISVSSLRNEALGIDLPQLLFHRRTNELISFMVIKLTERQIWQAIEDSGVPYEDWAAYKIPGDSVLHVLIEPKDRNIVDEDPIKQAIQEKLIAAGRGSYTESGVQEDWRDELAFSVDITLLPCGTFDGYTAMKREEGADPAHLKPPHINPQKEVLDYLLKDTEEITVVKRKSGHTDKEPAKGEKRITV